MIIARNVLSSVVISALMLSGVVISPVQISNDNLAAKQANAVSATGISTEKTEQTASSTPAVSSTPGTTVSRSLPVSSSSSTSSSSSKSATTTNKTSSTAAASTKSSQAVKTSAAVSSTSKATAIINTAKKYIGVPYVYGGTTPSGFDCSGFVQYAFNKNGISLPRVSRDQYKVGTSVSYKNLRPGDLIFFSLAQNGVVDHVGIYIGNQQFINASSSKGVTIYTIGPYWSSHYLGAKRVL